MSLQDQIEAAQRFMWFSCDEAHLVEADLCAPLSPEPTQNPSADATYSGWLAPGQRVFHRPFSGVRTNLAFQYGQGQDDPPMNEVAAWRLARRLGPPWDEFVPPCVLRSFDPQGPGSFQMGVVGAVADPVPMRFPWICDAAAFWDCLVGQQDRNWNNCRWDAAGGQLFLIDHGFCFATSGDRLNASVFLEARHAAGRKALSLEEMQIVESLDSSPDLYGAEALLAPRRAEALRLRLDRLRMTGGLLALGDFG